VDTDSLSLAADIAAMTTRYRSPVAPRHYIREWLTELSLNQQDLADLMEIDKSNITRWIKHPRRVNIDVLQGIYEALKPQFPSLTGPSDFLKPPAMAMAERQIRAAAQTIVGQRQEEPKIPPQRPGRGR